MRIRCSRRLLDGPRRWLPTRRSAMTPGRHAGGRRWVRSGAGWVGCSQPRPTHPRAARALRVISLAVVLVDRAGRRKGLAEHEGAPLRQDLLERAEPRLRGPTRHLLVVEHIARGQPREEGHLGLVRARRRAAERSRSLAPRHTTKLLPRPDAGAQAFNVLWALSSERPKSN